MDLASRLGQHQRIAVVLVMVCAVEEHLYCVVYYRPWYRWFRKTKVLRCWLCDLRVEEP